MKYKIGFYISLLSAHLCFWIRIFVFTANGNTFTTAVCMTLSLLFWLIACILFFQAIKKILLAAKTSHELKILVQQQIIQQKQETNLKEVQKQADSFQKEAVCQMKTLQKYIQDSDLNAASAYLKNISEVFDATRFHPLCQDSLISAILQNKKEDAQRKNIQIEYLLSFPDKLELIHTDLTSLFFNLLDNGIEACELSGAKKPFITLRVNFQANFLYITMNNSKSPQVLFNYATTKSDTEFHGFGLKIIEEIVESYDGSMELTDRGDTFESKIMLKFRGGESLPGGEKLDRNSDM